MQKSIFCVLRVGVKKLFATRTLEQLHLFVVGRRRGGGGKKEQIGIIGSGKGPLASVSGFNYY